MKTQDQSSPTQEMNPLLNLAIGESQRRNQTMRDLAGHLDISYTYLMAVARGERPADTMARKVYIAFAEYLDIPIAQVYLLSGALKPTDFVVEATVAAKLERLFERMRSDKEWCGLMPTSAKLVSLDSDIKILIGFLYERATLSSGLGSVSIEDPNT
jgi:transcriptional regulator with XRE-family HTH domain